MSAPEPLAATEPAHRIADDAEAIAVAHRLARDFALAAAERDRTRRLPWPELEAWSRSGLAGITVPRDHGGAGASAETIAEVFRILSAADPSIGQIPQNHFGFLWRMREAATSAQQAQVFGEALAGRRFGNAGPERKTRNLLHITTRLQRTPEGLRLNGERFYSTGALFAHWVPTRAVDDDGRMVHLWVRRDAPGLTVIDDWSAMGQRTTASGSVVFADVPVEDGNVIAALGDAVAPSLLGPYAQLMQAAIDQGIAEAAVQDAIEFVRDRARPWMDSGVERASDDPYIIADIGRLEIDLHAAHAVLIDAAQRFDQIAAQPATAASTAEASVVIAMAKVLTTRISLEASEKLFELAGSSATRASHGLDRHWRNARTHTLHDPVRWKLHLVGNAALNGIAPPQHPWN